MSYFFSLFIDVSPSEVQEKEVIVGIVTDIDLLHHVSQKESRSGSSSGGKPKNVTQNGMHVTQNGATATQSGAFSNSIKRCGSAHESTDCSNCSIGG